MYELWSVFNTTNGMKNRPLIKIEPHAHKKLNLSLGLAYLADIIEQLNRFNLRLRGPDTNISQFADILSGFIEKIHNWNRRVNQETLRCLKTYLNLNLVSVH